MLSKKAASPQEKYGLISRLEANFKQVSIRKLCEIVSYRRQSYYQSKKPVSSLAKANQLSDSELISAMQSVRKEQISWGYELIYSYLRNIKGLKFCKKRRHRLYQEARTSLWRNPKKPGIRREFQDLIAPQRPNEGWALDFLSEMVMSEKDEWYRLLNVVDECSRRCPWLSSEQSIPAKKLVEVLDNLLKMRGKPLYIRTDNGPEYISKVLAAWAERNGIEQKFIQPGKPTQNGIVERLNGTLRRECLNIHCFVSKEELDRYLDKWFLTYNFERPHSSLNFLTPVQFENQKSSNFDLLA